MAELVPADRQQAVAETVGDAVRDDQGDVRPRNQHQDRHGQDEGEEEVRIQHRGSLAAAAPRRHAAI